MVINSFIEDSFVNTNSNSLRIKQGCMVVSPCYQVDCLTMKRKALHSLKVSFNYSCYQLALHNDLNLQQHTSESLKYYKIKLS
jgi:hypothetical protein